MTLSDMVDAFVVGYEGRDSALPGRLEWWRDELGDREVADIDVDAIDASMVRLAQRGRVRHVRGRGLVSVPGRMAPATLNRYRAALASLFKWAKRRRLLGRAWRNPLTEVPIEPEDNARDEFLTAEQVEVLIKAARVARWRKLPALIRVAFTTGLRKGSLMGLRWRDVDLDAGRVTVARTKNGAPHVAVLSAAAIAELRAIRPCNASGGELVFCGKHESQPHRFDGAFRRALADAKLPATVTFHTLRHSCATHLARAGVSLQEIAAVMAHRSLTMTRRYSHHLVADRQRLVEAHFR